MVLRQTWEQTCSHVWYKGVIFLAKYILKRILWMIPVLFAVVIVVFTIMYFTPGDPVVAVLGANYTEAAYEAKAAELGLNDPYIVQLGKYIGNLILRFDFGKSYINNRSVTIMIFERVKVSAIIGVFSIIIAQLLAIPLGIVAATHHMRALDYGITVFCVVMAAIPGFLIAIFAMLLFCAKLRWLPAAGVTEWTGYILPILCSIFHPLVTTTRMTRSSMLEVIRQDYIRTARAKGVPEKEVLSKHALRNALIPVLTMMGMQMGAALAGSILVETIFTVPGMGILLKEAISNQDYPVVEGVLIFMSFFMAVMNLLTDIAYGLVDPRVYEQISGGKSRAKKAVVRRADV